MRRNPRRIRWTTVALAAAVTLVASACGGGPSAQDGDSPLLVGTSLPLTGQFSQPGTEAKRGYEVWQATVNERGGLLGRQVKLVVKDDSSNQNTVVADYNALISRDKVDLLLGSFSSLLNLPASAVAERNKMLFVEPAGGSPEMFDRGFKYLIYSQQGTADRQGVAFAEWIAGLPEGRRPETAAYPVLDDPFAKPNVQGIRKILEKAGIETVYSTTYAPDTKNFDTIVTRIKAAEPDLVVQGAVFEDGVGLVRSMRKANVTTPWFYQTTAPSMGHQYAEGIGAENTEGILYAISHVPTAKTPGNEEFVAEYQEMFGQEPTEDAADAFAAGQVLEAAAQGVGSMEDQLALADWLRKNTVETILGELSWNADGSPKGEFLVGQWQNGKTEVVLPKEVATSARIVEGWRPGGAGR
ncbi:amino acid ABC transporter substrate-binding protein [Streptomyces sp. NPDC059076]|uniref:amino acid ABC transporter substrate-binding protein n=1 Tax=unclassified Streptomyces TaxID=2593676 RepID=UPI00368B4A56